jgi:hypothetical protein
VEVFGELVRRGVDFSATVVGDGPAAADLKDALEKAGLESRVRLTGGLPRPAINKIWARSDVSVSTSAYEGLPLAVLEAMAWRVCPVVMAIDSGLPELLTDKRNSRVVPQGDCVAMARVLEELANDRSQAHRLGLKGRGAVQKRCSVAAHFGGLRKILGKVVSAPEPSPERVPKDPTTLAVERLVGRLASEDRPVVVYGVGMIGRKIVDACLAAGLEVQALVDSDPAREGWLYRGIRCHSPKALSNYASAVFAVGSVQFVEPISARIREALALTENKSPPILVLA